MKINIWSFLLLFVISMARIGMGIYNALSGPTLLYLSRNVHVRVNVISTMFTGRSIGNLIGAVFGGTIKRLLGGKAKQSLLLGGGVAVLGVMEFVVPWITGYWMLMSNIVIGGIMYGFLDAGYTTLYHTYCSGLQALILQLWGEQASRPHIQVFHCMYSVGAFMAPFIAQPFLEMASESKKTNDRCPQGSEIYHNENTSTTLSTTLNVTSASTDEFNPIAWSYIIAAIWLIFVSLLLIALSSMGVENQVSSSITGAGKSSENRKEEPISDLVWVFLGIIGYNFFCVTVANIPYYFTYSIAICSKLHFSVADATRLNSVFWLGYGLGRVCGAFVSNRLKPRTIIAVCISGAVVDMILMSIWGEKTPWLAWMLIGIHGFTTSMLYPCGVSWLSEITNVSGTYMFIFNLGNALGSLSMSPLAGYIFDINPFAVMYLVLGLACGNALVFAFAEIVGRRHLNNIRRRERKETETKLHLMKSENSEI